MKEKYELHEDWEQRQKDLETAVTTRKEKEIEKAKEKAQQA